MLTRRARIVTAATFALLAGALLFLAAFPVGWLKHGVERRLSQHLGLPATVGAIERGGLSFTPTVTLSDVRIAQPQWAGRGDLATIRTAKARLNVFGFLLGRSEPQLLTLTGAELTLLRDARGRENWRTDTPTASGAVSLAALTMAEVQVRYSDAYRNRAFAVTLRYRADSGLTATGGGQIDGAPITLSARAPEQTGRAWPFEAAIDGDALSVRVRGEAARRFDFDHATFDFFAQTDDLMRLDRLFELGLFHSQPTRLTAKVQRDGAHWTISDVSATIGTSMIAGKATLIRDSARAELDATIAAQKLDLADLDNSEGLAAALALERAVGRKVAPNLPVNLANVSLTKARVAFSAQSLTRAGEPTLFTSASGVLTLDDKLLVARPLRFTLAKGELTGSAIIDQRQGRATPLVELALDLRDSSLGAIGDTPDGGASGGIDAALDARVRLSGSGDTLRGAIANSTGAVGLAARDGALPAKLAALMGFDIGRRALAGDNDRAQLRCAVIRVAVEPGVGKIETLVIDTDMGQTIGKGAVTLPDEELAISLSGAAKPGSVLRLPGALAATGTLRDPRVIAPRDLTSIGAILGAIGRTLIGDQPPLASDADCPALTAAALR